MVMEKLALDDPQWSQMIYHRFNGDSSFSLALDRSVLQESHLVFNLIQSRKIAEKLIGQKGELLLDGIPEEIVFLKKEMYPLNIKRQWNVIFYQHILQCLEKLKDSRALQLAIKKIGKPYSNPMAEDLIRLSLDLPEKKTCTDRHARLAALSAWFCPLRQSVGSCFATAPAIMVQREQPEQMFADFYELLGTGRLKRTFGGIEYAVPLSPTMGAGDLRKTFLIPAGDLPDDLPLHHSPGLARALLAADVIKTQDPDEILQLINSALAKLEGSAVLISAEKLLQLILLDYLGLTHDGWQSYKLRPKELLGVQGMYFAPQEKKIDSQGYQGFEMRLDAAKRAFKALSDHALLRAWEYTLASFAETKSSFTRWNLYASLGFDPKQKGGIGEALFFLLQQKLEQCNEKVRRLQEEYEVAYQQIQYYQSRIRRAASESEARWIRAEYQSKANEFYTLEELRNKTHAKASAYANFFDELIEAYNVLFPRYFQEVYDAEMQGFSVGPFDDQPAGFRLLYKHGRSNTSLWTLIHSPKEFVESLSSFFIATETELAGMPLFHGLEDDVGEIVTTVVATVRSDQFIKTAFDRMALAYNKEPVEDPLENLEKIDKKPWAYTSGGVIETLLSCYFKRDEKPSEVSRWVESPAELLIFLIDTLKQLGDSELDRFLQDPDRSMLMHSPTHAFLFKPGWEGVKKLWQSREYTYTFVRDTVINPTEAVVSQILLSDEQIRILLEGLKKIVPISHRHYFKEVFSIVGGPMLAMDFRQHLVNTVRMTNGLHAAGQPVITSDEIDGYLYSSLPLCPSYLLKERVQELLSALPIWKKEWDEKLENVFEEQQTKRFSDSFIPALQLIEIALGALILTTGKSKMQENVPLQLVKMARERGWLLPEPLLFADSNWSKDYFAMLVSPGDGKFSLWSVDPLGVIGTPMLWWKMWLDGSRQSPKWGLFHKVREYQGE